MFGVPASACICTSTNWRDCDDDCDACWGEECHAALQVSCTKDPECELAGGLCENVRECGNVGPECPDCRKRVEQLWALVADEELPYDELPAGWEQRCARHAAYVRRSYR
jgi:hypothetical protein